MHGKIGGTAGGEPHATTRAAIAATTGRTPSGAAGWAIDRPAGGRRRPPGVCAAGAAAAIVILAAALVMLSAAGPARADVTWSGDVVPDDPTTWTAETDGYIGNDADGTLDITAGGCVSAHYVYVARSSGTTGALRVAGPGSTWANEGCLYVGYYGAGTLDISDGGTVGSGPGQVAAKPGSTGAVTVSGAGSTWTGMYSLHIGEYGTGTLAVTGGGVVSNDCGCIGDEAGSVGAVTVDGADSVWTSSGSLYVGGAGRGTLEITGGAAVSTDSACIAFDEGSGAVTVDGAALSCTSGLTVGRYGTAELLVTGGGAVHSAHCYIGKWSGSAGTVTVNGAGSTWTNTGMLRLGEQGNGALRITAGGAVTIHKDILIGGGAGTIHLDGGTLTTGGFLGRFDDLSGTGTLHTHGLVTDDDLVFDATHGPSQSFVIDDNPGQNITVHLEVDGGGTLGAGFSSAGTMIVSDGIAVASTAGYIGYKEGAVGSATVAGPGSTWTSGDLRVGYRGSGTLKVSAGGGVSSNESCIGSYAGSTGAAEVKGQGSTWTNSGDLWIGSSGSGTLSITDGGIVTVQGRTQLSRFKDSSGAIHFDDGTLTTGSLLAAADDLSGRGTIYAHGFVSDVDLVFDAAHGMRQTFAISNSPGQDIAVHLDVDGSADMGAAFGGQGTMAIRDGVTVASAEGYIAYASGSTGTVTVDGPGSRWTASGPLYVGRGGDGTLEITGGGAAHSNGARVGQEYRSTGTVTVDGAGSQWISGTGMLHIGYDGAGTLAVTNGGTVRSMGGLVAGRHYGTGVVVVDGAGSTWAISFALLVGTMGDGTLTITGGGLVSVDGTLHLGPYGMFGDGVVNMASGGMLALFGRADGSLAEFLNLVEGTDAIRYWNETIADWDDITNATPGEEYYLHYRTAGDLAGYTVLTVPEPATLALLAPAALALLRRRRRSAGR